MIRHIFFNLAVNKIMLNDALNNKPSNKAELAHAIEQTQNFFNQLIADGFDVMQNEDGEQVGLFKRLKNGKTRKTPSAYVFFNPDNAILKWSVTDDRKTRSFKTALEAVLLLIQLGNSHLEGQFTSPLFERTASNPAEEKANRNRIDSCIDELIGMCRGILSGGFVMESQVENLYQWFRANPQLISQFPANEVFTAVNKIRIQQEFTSDNELELLNLFTRLIGSIDKNDVGQSASTQLPLTEPPPKLFFNQTVFVLTGVFKISPRSKLVEIIEDLGGKVTDTINHHADYLVIGNIGSGVWKHSTHGRKIEKAVAVRDKGEKIAIVSEDYLMKQGAVMFQIANRRLLR